jgi:hypothetical protein
MDQWKLFLIDLQPFIFVKVVGVFDDFYAFPYSTFKVMIFFGKDFVVFQEKMMFGSTRMLC